ncbi:MAG: Lipoyl synthase [candidate division WS2 bacterium]|nr:Lipoyl synthase [Candidatus Psychracetigena formicireducens]
MEKKNTVSKPILRKPGWITSRLSGGLEYPEIKKTLKKYHLHTICEDALCPNKGECWANKHVTFLILGNVCTRNCLFCKVSSGNPQGEIDELEPERIAQAVKELAMEYVVITSTTRDDLLDGGASHFARTLKCIKSLNSSVRVELLIPDFHNQESSLRIVVQEKPEVIAHNIETVRRLTPMVRDHYCSYEKSLGVLTGLKKIAGNILIKSGLMVGLGESESEILDTIRDIRKTETEIISIGQYLKPSKNHYEVKKFYTPNEFVEFSDFAYSIGFTKAISGPLVRSSYLAGK